MIVATVLVQVTWGPRVTIAETSPNLVLVAVIAIAWTRGVPSGMAWACVAGLMLDLTAPGPLGPHALALVASAYLTGFWTRNVDPASRIQPVLAAAACTALYSLILVGAADTFGMPVPSLGVAAQLAGVAAIYNAVFVAPALSLARRVLAPPPVKVQPA
jgi:rod shape-determining protein MreD